MIQTTHTRRLLLASVCFFANLSTVSALDTISAAADIAEAISLVPDTFGDLAGDLLVPDATFNGLEFEEKPPIWVLPAAGGPPRVFARVDFSLRGGIFVPDDFGDVGGQYLVGGNDFIPPLDEIEFPLTLRTRIVTLDAAGSATDFSIQELELQAADDLIPIAFPTGLTTPLIAPPDFGPFGGDLIYTDQNSGVFVFDHDGNAELLFNSVGFSDFTAIPVSPFGAVFAPQEFGFAGGTLLINDSRVDDDNTEGILPILFMDAEGNVGLFSTIPFDQEQRDDVGLRQMIFIPDGFGDLGGNLLVSVAGSNRGGGGAGRLLVLNELGEIVASLDSADHPLFDPRALFFSEDGRLLIGDASGRILAATPNDFQRLGQLQVELQAGDADEDFDFDQLDLVQVQVAAKYLTGSEATWGEGDWNGAPGGSPGSPPAGDGQFNQLDIVAAQQAGNYLTGPYAALNSGGSENDTQTSIVYDANTGALSVDAPAGTELTSINIDSAVGIFTGDPAENLGGSFDNDSDNNIFKATFGSSFASLSFGNVAQSGLAEQFLLDDLTVVGSLAGGGGLGDVDLIYVPEPSSVVLLVLGAFLPIACRRMF